MNYSTIVYNAFTTEGKFVSDYFISECKKAERDEFITPEMFIAGCASVCNGLKTEIKKTFYNWATECKQYDEQGNELPFNIDEISYPFGGLQVDNKHIDFIIEMIEIAKIELIDLPDAVKIGEKIDELIAEKFDSKKAPPAPPAKLIKSLTINQQTYLYSKLTESLFLPDETDFDSFCFVFGNSKKPENFKPLKWLKNRQFLRELITTLKHPKIKIPTSKYKLPPYFLDEEGKPIKELPTNTPKDLKIEHYITDLAKM